MCEPWYRVVMRAAIGRGALSLIHTLRDMCRAGFLESRVDSFIPL